MPHFIEDACVLCGVCAEACPEGCISEGEEQYVIDPEQCTDCGDCLPVCPVDDIVALTED